MIFFLDLYALRNPGVNQTKPFFIRLSSPAVSWPEGRHALSVIPGFPPPSVFFLSFLIKAAAHPSAPTGRPRPAPSRVTGQRRIGSRASCARDRPAHPSLHAQYYVPIA